VPCDVSIKAEKKSLTASERNPLARQQWQQEMAAPIANRLVFLDECGTHLALTRLYGWAPRGQRLRACVPKNRGQNTTLLGALSHQGIIAAMTIEGAADGLAFEAFVEAFLVPVLQPGQIVILDNLNTHKNQRVRELIEDAGCSLRFLPTYSPDLNPIELAWSKVKGYLRGQGIFAWCGCQRARKLGKRNRSSLGLGDHSRCSKLV
jgi:transposase